MEQEIFAIVNGLELPPPGLIQLWVPVHSGPDRKEGHALVDVDVFFGKQHGEWPWGYHTPHVGHAWAPHHSRVGRCLPGKSMYRYEYPIL